MSVGWFFVYVITFFHLTTEILLKCRSARRYPVNQTGWQAYDVIWTAPRFAAPACVTALHKGVLVQNHVALQGETV